MTKRERAKLRASLYSLAHDIFGGLILAAIVVILSFLFAVR